MSVVNLLDRVTEWVQTNICPKILLKVPPDDTEPCDQDYINETANPTAFSMYVPTKDKLAPPIKSPYPSVCVRFMDGTDDLTASKGSIGIQLCFSAWNPGTHGADVYEPKADGTFHRWTGEEADAYFKRNGDGWRDVWNAIDIALRAVESTTNIAGFEVDRSVPVKFGPLTEQEAIPDYYPFWYAWVSFQLNYPLRRNNQDIQKYL